MTSKTSFFDRTIFLRELRRTAPLWVLYLLIVLLLPFGLLSSYDPARMFEPTDDIIRYANVFSSLGAFCYGAMLAWVLHMSLFRTTPTNFYAALPIRREALFTTRYLTGLFAAAVPNLLTAALTYLVTTALGSPQPWACLVLFGSSMLGFVFFYGLATVCCMASGHVVMMPILYIILNFVVVVVEIILAILLESFVYGMPAIYNHRLAPFSPLYQMLFCDYGGYSDINGFHFESWGYLAVLAGAGLALSALALFLFRRREMERSGDVIAVRWLRPVFQYAFTLGCALVFCQVVKSFVSSTDFSHSFVTVLLLLLFGALIGHFAARMMLGKTLRVFRGGWRSLVICCAVLVLGFGSMQLDLFGYCTYIPDVSEIRAVSLQSHGISASLYPVEGADAAEAVTALHQHFLDARTKLSALEEGYSTFYIVYNLKDGQTVTRVYRLPRDKDAVRDPLTNEFCDIYYSLPFVLAREIPADVAEENITSCMIGCQFYETATEGSTEKYTTSAGSIMIERTESSENTTPVYTLGSDAARELFSTCILPDFEDSSLGRTATFPIYDETHSLSGCDFWLEFTYLLEDGNASFYIGLTDDASRTIAYLQDLGYSIP